MSVSLKADKNIKLNVTIRNNKSSDKFIYKTSITLIFLSFITSGIGSHILGLEIPFDVSTFSILLLFFVQLISSSLRFPKLLIFSMGLVIIQTFIINWTYIDFLSSFKHMLGLILYALVIFNFFSVNRLRIIEIVKLYYIMCFFIAFLAIIQVLIFVSFGYSFLPQNLIAGVPVATTGNALSPEILGVLPRAIGMSTEPANFAVPILPAVYVSILVLTNSNYSLGLCKKSIAFVILIGFILSFSLVAYVGLLLCFIFIFGKIIKTNIIQALVMVGLLISLLYFILQTPIGEKFWEFLSNIHDITGTQYTVNDQSSFALLSNLMVAFKSLEISSYFGTGLNTHMITYDATINDIFSLAQIPNELNRENAGSLFIRILSEFGLPGFFLFFFFLFHYRIKQKLTATPTKLLNNISVVVIISYALRNGHYLNIFFFFFIALYYYSYLLSKSKSENLNYEGLKYR